MRSLEGKDRLRCDILSFLAPLGGLVRRRGNACCLQSLLDGSLGLPFRLRDQHRDALGFKDLGRQRPVIGNISLSSHPPSEPLKSE